MSKNCVEGSTEKKNDEERINKNVKEDYLICSICLDQYEDP